MNILNYLYLFLNGRYDLESYFKIPKERVSSTIFKINKDNIPNFLIEV